MSNSIEGHVRQPVDQQIWVKVSQRGGPQALQQLREAVGEQVWTQVVQQIWRPVENTINDSIQRIIDETIGDESANR